MRAPCSLLALVLALVLPATLLSAVPATAEGVLADRIVAVVDGQLITLVGVRRRAAPALRKLENGAAPGWNGGTPVVHTEKSPLQVVQARAVLVEALEASIDDLLVERMAAALDERVDDAAIDRAIDASAAGRHMSRAGLFAQAWADGYAQEDVRADHRRAALERIVLAWAYARQDRGDWPSGDDARSVAARTAWRREWLASEREKACIDRRLTP